jgi:hypothetical protein
MLNVRPAGPRQDKMRMRGIACAGVKGPPA